MRLSSHPSAWLHITFMPSICGNQHRVHTCNNAVTTTVKSLCIMDGSTAITVTRCGRNDSSPVQLLGFHANLMELTWHGDVERLFRLRRRNLNETLLHSGKMTLSHRKNECCLKSSRPNKDKTFFLKFFLFLNMVSL